VGYDRETDMFRALVLAICCVVPIGTIRHGTALAALRDTNEIAIAADSRVLDRLGMRLPDACKLHVVGDTVIALHGLAEDSESDYDLLQITIAALAPRADLTATVMRIATAGAEPLSRAVQRLLEDDPLMLRSPDLRSSPAGVVIARFEHGTPRLGYVKFVSKPDGHGGLRLSTETLYCPGTCPTGIGAVLVSPDAGAAPMFDLQNPQYWKRPLGPQAIAFVDHQLSDLYPNVGPPVDAIRVADGKIIWLARKDGCPASEAAAGGAH
jgi:hypothetical protein